MMSSSRQDRLDQVLTRVERELGSLLDTHGRLSASKLSAFYGLSNVDAYAAKRWCERGLDQMACETDLGGSPEKPLSYSELAESLTKGFREVDAYREAKLKPEPGEGS